MSTVNSSMIKTVDYNESNQELNVVFKNDVAYNYLGVPKEEFTGLLDSPSKGRYMKEHIINSFKHVRLT